MHDLKRASVASILKLLQLFPCVTVLGPRQVGKTTLSKSLRPESPYFDLEKPSDFELISRDPYFFLKQFEQSIVIDEAQRLPDLFPSLRVRIDEQRSNIGIFLLTGSSSPILLNNISESLAGRVAFFAEK